MLSSLARKLGVKKPLSGGAPPGIQPPPAPDGLSRSLAELDAYSAQLRKLADSVTVACACVESLSASLLGVAECLVPLNSTHGGLPGPAAELLLGATSFASGRAP